MGFYGWFWTRLRQTGSCPFQRCRQARNDTPMTRGFFTQVRRAVAAVLATGAFGAAAAVVEQVQIRPAPGTQVATEAVEAKLESQAGQDFSPETLSEDIKRLYQSGFSDVDAQVEAVAEGKVRLVFTVTPSPTIRKVLISGNKLVKTRVLNPKITIGAGDTLDLKTLGDVTAALREKYRSLGYHKTTVASKTVPVADTGQVDVTFEIDEEPRYKVRSVSFSGNAVFGDRELAKGLKTRHSIWSRFFGTGYMDEDKLADDLAILHDRYADLGYLDFAVREVTREISPDQDWVSLTFVLDEGRPYSTGSVDFDGNKHFSNDELALGLGLKTGEVYSPSVQGRDSRTVRRRYQTVGYLDAQVYARRSIDPETRRVDVTYRIAEGAASHIRDIQIVGNRVTQDQVIRRELALHPGDLGDIAKIDASQSRVQNLNYFESVTITPLATEREDRKDLRIDVKEKRTGQLNLGAGFSSEDSLVGMFEIAQSNFDWRNWPRFTGGGQRLRLRLQAGTQRNDFSLSFTEPWLYNRRLRLDLDAYSNDRDQDEYTEERLGLGLNLTRSWRTHWRQSVGLRLQQIDLVDFETTASQLLKDEEGDYTANAISLSLSRDTRNRYINPSSGSTFSVTADLQSELFGSYSNIYRLMLRSTKYVPLQRGLVLKLRGELGVVDKASGDEVAIFDRFFTGGANSLRGFDRREVGPADVNDDPIGGRSLLLGSAELLIPVYNSLLGSLFCDAGNVWADAWDWDPADLNVSVGVGIQLNLPIGPIRLDYGLPVVTADGQEDSGGQIHFNLGYMF